MGRRRRRDNVYKGTLPDYTVSVLLSACAKSERTSAWTSACTHTCLPLLSFLRLYFLCYAHLSLISPVLKYKVIHPIFWAPVVCVCTIEEQEGEEADPGVINGSPETRKRNYTPALNMRQGQGRRPARGGRPSTRGLTPTHQRKVYGFLDLFYFCVSCAPPPSAAYLKLYHGKAVYRLYSS